MMHGEDRPDHIKASAMAAFERDLRRTMTDVYHLAGWMALLRTIAKVQQEIGAEIKAKGRQGEGGWIF